MMIVQKLDQQSCGCDAHSHKQALISIDDALSRISRETMPVSDIENLPLANCVGKVLARPVRSLGMTPPFDNSAMDGYAVHTSDLQGDGPWSLKIQGRAPAGKMPADRLLPGSTFQIITGAPMPHGANAVVMQEDVERSDGLITVTRHVTSGAHVRLTGEDMTSGKMIVPAGRLLSDRDIAACAAAGHEKLTVVRRLRVALLVTGDEIRANGQARGPAGIWDVNTPMLSAALSRLEIDLCGIHFCEDTRNGLREQLEALAHNVDLIVTTGGISVGEEDHVKPALQDLGGSLIFSGVAVKPGKPISFGRLNQACWLGLPGNPLSAYLTWQLFGKAVCQALSGASSEFAQRRHVVLSKALHHNPGRCELRLACLVGNDGDGREAVDFLDATHSGRVAQLPLMDGVLFVPSDVEHLPKGALAEFQPF